MPKLDSTDRASDQDLRIFITHPAVLDIFTVRRMSIQNFRTSTRDDRKFVFFFNLLEKQNKYLHTFSDYSFRSPLVY